MNGKNNVFTGFEEPMQTCYVRYIGENNEITTDCIEIPEGLEDNPFAMMELEWIDLWGGFIDAIKYVEEFDETTEDIDDTRKLINESNLTDPQKNWSKAVYLKYFFNREFPFGEGLTFEDFINGANR